MGQGDHAGRNGCHGPALGRKRRRQLWGTVQSTREGVDSRTEAQEDVTASSKLSNVNSGKRHQVSFALTLLFPLPEQSPSPPPHTHLKEVFAQRGLWSPA